jgi:hypothetical protein
MFLPRLIRRFVLMQAMADDGAAGGGGMAIDPAPTADAPAVDNSLPTPDAPATTQEPAADPFAGLKSMLDQVGTEPAPGQPRDPLGRFAPIDPAAKTTPPVTPEPTPAPKPAVKPEDDLTPPEGLSERAQARFAQMAERVKAIPDLERRATEAETQLTQVRDMVSQSGLSPQEFTDMLGVGKLLKATDPASLEQALQRIDAIRSDVALRLGRDIPGTDPLAAHPDLKAAVDGMTLSREHAMEIARLRPKAQQADTLTAEQREYQQHQQAIQTATTAMQTALESRKAEPGWQSKMQAISAFLADAAKLQKFVTDYQPHQWSSALMLMYDNLSAQPVAAPPAGPQPLRPNNVRAGSQVVTGPVTAKSALEGAFASIGM